MGQVAAPLFSNLPELVVSDLGLDGNAHSGGGGIMQGSGFHQAASSQNSLAGGTIHSDMLKICRRGSFKD